MNATICTCGVLTGGARDQHSECPMHRRDTSVSFWANRYLLAEADLALAHAELQKVRASNAELLAALKGASADLVLYLGSPLRVQIDAAIAKAEGRS